MAELSEQDIELQELETVHGPEMIGPVARLLLLAGLAVIVLGPVIGQVIYGWVNPPMLELKLFGITWPQPAGTGSDATHETALPPLEPGQKRVEAVVTAVSDVTPPTEGDVYVNALRGIAFRTVSSDPADATDPAENGPRDEPSVLQHIRSFEVELENDSFFVEPYQQAYNATHWWVFREGNRRVYASKGSPLFFKPNLTALFARGPFAPMPISVSQPPPPDDGANPWVGPVRAIANFAEQLASRDIQLVLAPVPSKVQIYPESLGLPAEEPLRYVWEKELTSQLESAGVVVVDLVEPLWQKRNAAPLFLETDTHWTPTGMQLAAQAIARNVRALEGWKTLPASAARVDRSQWRRQQVIVSNQGDLNRMLGLDSPNLGPKPESAQLTKIVSQGSQNGGSLDNPESPVVLLGDSYVNVFHSSSEDVAWGDNSGLPEHLAWELGLPLSTVAVNGAGQTTSRRQLIRKHGDLQGKKIVVWVFNARSLFLPEALQRAETDKWELVQLPEPQPQQAGQPADIQPEEGEIPPAFSALVWAYRNREPQPGAQLKPGDRLVLTLQPTPGEIDSEQKFDETDYTLPQYFSPNFQVLPR